MQESSKAATSVERYNRTVLFILGSAWGDVFYNRQRGNAVGEQDSLASGLPIRIGAKSRAGAIVD